MERTDILELMTTLKRYGMRAAYDEVMATGIKRRHEPPRIVGDLLAAEIAEKQARSIKYQLTIAKLPLAKDIDDFDFAGTPIMASNSDWVVPVSYDERRFFVRNVAETYRGQREHFAAIGAQMDNGGLAAMIHEMLHRDISRFDVGAVPNTDALAEQKNLSLNTLDRWWLAVLERGFLWRSRHGIEAFSEWQDFCTTELLNRSYLQWCADNRVQRPESRELLGPD